ncbi:otu family cysteine protease [Cystoisospora suis]|uniref:Otu family cysteine protease n=1 Tax=Cystoisospora suis TaxID=483139 RepID=A0A2C6J4X6_9APIC|nr:otu family cysteine protease [Cystoisospora suis]
MQKFKRDMKLLQAEEKKALSKARGGGREEKEKISALYERKRKDLEEKLRRDLSLHDHRGSLPVDDRDDRQEEEESSPGRDSAKGEEEEKERGEKQVRASSKTNEEKISDGLCSEFSSLSFYGSRMRSSHEREEEERTGGGQGQQGGRGGRISKAYKRRQKKRIEEEEKLQLLQAQREAEGPSQGEIEMESLCMHLADQQLAIHPIAADGHCMYRSDALSHLIPPYPPSPTLFSLSRLSRLLSLSR